MFNKNPFAARDEREADEREPVRVNDRRRININNLDDPLETLAPEADAEASAQTATATGRAAAAPAPKPAYVQELETRAQSAEQKLQAAEQKLFDVQARFDEARGKLQRETDEMRQRLNRSADERALQGKIAFITQLLPVMDNLQLALNAAETSASNEDATNLSLASLLDGLRGTLNGFASALDGAGVEAVPGVGAQFDPELHEAVDIAPTDNASDGEVMKEYSRGYRIGERLIRPARVQVGRA